MQTLETLVHEFTRSHLTRYHTPGKDEYHKQISLLEQLENLKTERRNTSGGTRGGGSCIPLNQNATLIQTTIEHTIRYQLGRINLDALLQPLPQRLETWAKSIDEIEARDTLTHWKAAILALTDVLVPIDVYCPACGIHTVNITSDGETRRQNAIIINTRTETASCLHCLTSWVGMETWEPLKQAAAPRKQAA